MSESEDDRLVTFAGVVLVRTCPRCGGSGWEAERPDEKWRRECYDCHSKGKLLTKDGQALLWFVLNNIDVTHASIQVDTETEKDRDRPTDGGTTQTD